MMQMPSLTKRLVQIRERLPWLTAGVILAAAYPVFLHPYFQSAQARSRSRNFEGLYAERLASMEKLGERLTVQLQRLEEWKKGESFSVFTPAEAEVFFARLEQGAVQTGCHLAALEYDLAPKGRSGLPDESEAVEIRAVKMQLYGTYDAWSQWVRQMESYPRCVLLESLKIESARERPGVLVGRVCLLVPIARDTDSREPSTTEKSKEQ
ncbi:MAG TPA: hypothetical protein PK054_10435 [Anaerohalosphaeraceae bacterium]|nr:hypothetical protein [Anaerohalosphaeraceae bacterium]HPP56982.1 hypothetical protein [Anaerohalosphaeraceae bacterium]